MRINPKLAHRLGGTDCIFYHTRNSWRVYPQKIERKQDERRRDGWVAFWVSAWSFSPTLFRFVFSRIYKRVLCIICVQWRVFFLGSSERTYGAVKGDRKRVTLCICNPTLCFFFSPPPWNIGIVSECKEKTIWKGILPEQILIQHSLPQTSLGRKWTIYATVVKKKRERKKQQHAVLCRTPTK